VSGRGGRRAPAALALAAALAALALPAAARGEAAFKGFDAAGLPTIRLTVVAPEGARGSPALRENGAPVNGLSADNLGRRKALVLAVDRSQSMEGRSLADAVRAARGFVARKPASDLISLVVFGRRAIQLTPFSSATIDVQSGLRTLAIDSVPGTALYDAVVLSAKSVRLQARPTRVVVLLTDGRDVSSRASLEEAIGEARRAGVSVYAIAIEGPQFTPQPLRQLSRATGGTYHGAASSAALQDIYRRLAGELGRTWQLSYYSSARPGDTVRLRVRFPGAPAATARFVIPNVATTVSYPRSEGLFALLRRHWWGAPLLGLLVAACLFAATLSLFAARRGSWLRGRLEPHVGGAKRRAAAPSEEERLSLRARLFRATERVFDQSQLWRRLERLLVRADVPLRTVELVYISLGASVLLGVIAAVAAMPSLVILLGFVVGLVLPVAVVAIKARRRLRSFEAQLPALLTSIAASLKVGHSFRQAIQTVVDDGGPPADKEFQRVLTETNLGRTMDGALAEMGKRIGSNELDFVLTSVAIQRQVGGSLAGLFELVADTVRQRQQFRQKVKSLTAMGRMSAYVLIALPFVLAGLVTLINGEYMSPLYETTIGNVLIGVVLVMMAVGSAILWRIASFKG
jgi:tight adherence protein B